MKKEVSHMLEVNKRQQTYYDAAMSGASEAKVNTGATNLWRRLRRRLFAGVNAQRIVESTTALHREWIGDVSKCKVLDLGVGSGNPLSLDLARSAREYVAIDLSPNRIAELQQKLDAAGINGARLYAVDFLDREKFPEMNFDVVYALAIFHHFQDLGAFLEELQARMAPGAIAVTFDPLQTWFPARLVRALYRPFQTDRAWEWPLTEGGLNDISSRFEIEGIRGIYGRSKWALPLGLLSPSLARRAAEKWHETDMHDRNSQDRLASCLQVSFLLRNGEPRGVTSEGRRASPERRIHSGNSAT